MERDFFSFFPNNCELLRISVCIIFPTGQLLLELSVKLFQSLSLLPSRVAK